MQFSVNSIEKAKLYHICLYNFLLNLYFSLSYKISCVHYAATNYSATNDQYCISANGEIGIEPVYEWND